MEWSGRDLTFRVFGVALLLVVFSYAEFIASVHTYSENRWQMIALAFCGLAVLGFAIKNWPERFFRRVASAATMKLGLVVTVVNAWYFVWAMRICSLQQTPR